MDHPVLVPTNNGKGGQRNHDQTVTSNQILPQDKQKLQPLRKNFTLTTVSIQCKY